MHMPHVLICGAGVTGLCLARQFQKCNIPFTIIEKKLDLGAEGAGIALPANALQALRFLDLGHEIDEHSHHVREIIYLEPNARILSRASLLDPPFCMDHFVALPRSKLLNILGSGLEKLIRFDTTVEALEECSNGMKVRFNHSTSEEFELVIGADGIYSRIRDLAFHPTPLIDFNVTTWRWICDYPTDYLQPTYMLGAQEVLMAYPIGKDLVYCYAHIFDPQKSFFQAEDRRAVLKKIFAGYKGIAIEMLNFLPENQEIIRGRVRSVSKVLFSHGRVGLVGDASSACSAVLQQGVAMGVEDVIALSELLLHFPVPKALRYYAEFRRERVNWVVQTSDRPMRKIAGMNSPLALFMRNALIKFKGPLNVQGWRKLFAENPSEQLTSFVHQALETERQIK